MEPDITVYWTQLIGQADRRAHLDRLLSDFTTSQERCKFIHDLLDTGLERLAGLFDRKDSFLGVAEVIVQEAGRIGIQFDRDEKFQQAQTLIDEHKSMQAERLEEEKNRYRAIIRGQKSWERFPDGLPPQLKIQRSEGRDRLQELSYIAKRLALEIFLQEMDLSQPVSVKQLKDFNKILDDRANTARAGRGRKRKIDETLGERSAKQIIGNDDVLEQEGRSAGMNGPKAIDLSSPASTSRQPPNSSSAAQNKHNNGRDEETLPLVEYPKRTNRLLFQAGTQVARESLSPIREVGSMPTPPSTTTNRSRMSTPHIREQDKESRKRRRHSSVPDPALSYEERVDHGPSAQVSSYFSSSSSPSPGSETLETLLDAWQRSGTATALGRLLDGLIDCTKAHIQPQWIDRHGVGNGSTGEDLVEVTRTDECAARQKKEEYENVWRRTLGRIVRLHVKFG